MLGPDLNQVFIAMTFFFFFKDVCRFQEFSREKGINWRENPDLAEFNLEIKNSLFFFLQIIKNT